MARYGAYVERVAGLGRGLGAVGQGTPSTEYSIPAFKKKVCKRPPNLKPTWGIRQNMALQRKVPKAVTLLMSRMVASLVNLFLSRLHLKSHYLLFESWRFQVFVFSVSPKNGKSWQTYQKLTCFGSFNLGASNRKKSEGVKILGNIQNSNAFFRSFSYSKEINVTRVER